MPSIAGLIEAFANAQLAREQQEAAQARLVQARRAGAGAARLRDLAAEVACRQVRADNLFDSAETLLPRADALTTSERAAATLTQ